MKLTFDITKNGEEIETLSQINEGEIVEARNDLAKFKLTRREGKIVKVSEHGGTCKCGGQ